MQSDKVKKNIIIFLITITVFYFLFLVLFNHLTYGNIFKRFFLFKSMNDFYTKRWALPYSKLYFEKEVVLVSLSLFFCVFISVLRLASAIASVYYLTSKTENLRGSSKWAEEDEIKDNGYLFYWKDLNKDNIKKPSIILGQSLKGVKIKGKSATEYQVKKNSKYLYGAGLSKKMGKSPEINHTLIFGTTGSGKGVSTIIPSLLSHSGSLICYDPAGENYRETSAYRSNIGNVLYFNPQDMNSTLHFNPFDWIRKTKNFIQTDIENIALVIIPVNPEAKEQFWDIMARLLFTINAGYLFLIDQLNCNLYQMTRLINILFEKDVELSSDGSILQQEEEKKEEKNVKVSFIAMLEEMEKRIQNNFPNWKEDSWENLLATVTLDNIRNFKMQVTSEATMGSIVSVYNSHMAFYANPNISKLMESTSFSPDDFMYNDKPLSIYLILLAEDQVRCKTFVRIFCECVLARMERDDARYKKDGKHTLLFLLDEFPLLGYMGSIERAIPVTRKYGVAFCLITQDLAQLEKAYTPKGAVSLANNMQIINVKKANDFETASWISKMIGKQTIEIERTSFSKQKGSLTSTSSSTSSSSEGRDLLDPSEVRRLENWKQIIFIQGAQPVLASKVQWFRTPFFINRHDMNYKKNSEESLKNNEENLVYAMGQQEEIENIEEMDEADLAFFAPPAESAGEIKEKAKENNVGQTDYLEKREIFENKEEQDEIEPENNENDNSFLDDLESEKNNNDYSVVFWK